MGVPAGAEALVLGKADAACLRAIEVLWLRASLDPGDELDFAILALDPA